MTPGRERFLALAARIAADHVGISARAWLTSPAIRMSFPVCNRYKAAYHPLAVRRSVCVPHSAISP